MEDIGSLFPNRGRTWILLAVLIILNYLVYYYVLYPGFLQKYLSGYEEDSLPAVGKVKFTYRQPKFITESVEPNIRISIDNQENTEKEIIVSVHPTDDDQNNIAVYSEKTDFVYSRPAINTPLQNYIQADIPSKAMVTGVFQVYLEKVTSSNPVRLEICVYVSDVGSKNKDQKVCSSRKEIELSLDRDEAFKHTLIGNILLPPWSNGLLAIVTLFLINIVQEHVPGEQRKLKNLESGEKTEKKEDHSPGINQCSGCFNWAAMIQYVSVVILLFSWTLFFFSAVIYFAGGNDISFNMDHYNENNLPIYICYLINFIINVIRYPWGLLVFIIFLYGILHIIEDDERLACVIKLKKRKNNMTKENLAEDNKPVLEPAQNQEIPRSETQTTKGNPPTKNGPGKADIVIEEVVPISNSHENGISINRSLSENSPEINADDMTSDIHQELLPTMEENPISVISTNAPHLDLILRVESQEEDYDVIDQENELKINQLEVEEFDNTQEKGEIQEEPDEISIRPEAEDQQRDSDVICPVCGINNSEYSKSCQKCGYPLICPKCGIKIENKIEACENCGSYLDLPSAIEKSQIIIGQIIKKSIRRKGGKS